MAVISRVSAPQGLQRVLQRQSVDHGRQHSHVVGGRLVDAGAGSLELPATQDIATADDDGNLATQLQSIVDLPRNIHDFVHGNSPFSGLGKTLTRQLQDDAAILGLVSVHGFGNLLRAVQLASGLFAAVTHGEGIAV